MKKLLQLLLAGMIPLSLSACSAAKSEPIGGYLAIYPALYEPDMGVEYASFHRRNIPIPTAQMCFTTPYQRTAGIFSR